MQKELFFSNINYTINMQVSLIPVATDWFAYKRTKILDNSKKEKIECGLCKNVDLEKLTTDPFFYPEHLDKGQKVFLVRRNFLEDYRYNTNSYKKTEWFPINLYTALKLELPENFVLLREEKEGMYFNLTDNKKVAKEIVFSQGTYTITEKDYNLEKVLEILSKREDIYISRTETKIKTDSNGIKYITFSWLPTDKDWEKYINAISGDKENEYKYILNEILRIPKLTDLEKCNKIIKNMANFINHTDIDEDICKKTICPLKQYEQNEDACIKCIINHFS